MSRITLASVGKTYGPRRVLENVCFTIGEGECFTILGPSGCGKTVILRLVAGFESPDSGRISIGEGTVADAEARFALPPEERRIGVVFQDYAVWPHKTVYRNVSYPLEVEKVPKAERGERTRLAVAQVGMAGLEERMPSQLSGGQQQRVALARALVREPDVMLLDEPLSNLDANLREEMRFEIKRLQRKTGMTVLYVTHDQEVALAISDRIAVMDSRGKLRQIGTPEEVWEKPSDGFVFRFLGVTNFIPVEIAGGRAVLRGTGTVLAERVPDEVRAYRDPTAGFRPMDALLTRPKDRRCRILRTALLGPMIDYRVDFMGTVIRVQQLTEEAVSRGLAFREGEECGIEFRDLKWFPGQGENTEENG